MTSHNKLDLSQWAARVLSDCVLFLEQPGSSNPFAVDDARTLAIKWIERVLITREAFATQASRNAAYERRRIEPFAESRLEDVLTKGVECLSNEELTRLFADTASLNYLEDSVAELLDQGATADSPNGLGRWQLVAVEVGRVLLEEEGVTEDDLQDRARRFASQWNAAANEDDADLVGSGTSSGAYYSSSGGWTRTVTILRSGWMPADLQHEMPERCTLRLSIVGVQYPGLRIEVIDGVLPPTEDGPHFALRSPDGTEIGGASGSGKIDLPPGVSSSDIAGFRLRVQIEAVGRSVHAEVVIA